MGNEADANVICLKKKKRRLRDCLATHMNGSSFAIHTKILKKTLFNINRSILKKLSFWYIPIFLKSQKILC